MPRPLLVIPDAPGEICASTEGGGAWRAMWLASSIISMAARPERPALDNGRFIAWSGSFAETEGSGLFDEDPRTWGVKGWEALERACRIPSLQQSSLLIRPHHRHVISDIPGCKRLLETTWAEALGITLAYDPASMCAPSMVAGVEDHLRRMYEAIDYLPPGRLGAVIVASVNPTGGAAVLSASATSDLARALAEKHVPPGIPLLTPG